MGISILIQSLTLPKRDPLLVTLGTFFSFVLALMVPFCQDQALSHSEAPPSPDRVKSEDIPALLPASPNTNTPLASDHPFGDTTPVDIKIKIKKGKKDDNCLALPPDVRARFLKGATLFPIDPDPLSVAVGRYALNMAYGAATVAMSWSKDDHKFLWPSYDWNPDMPRGPGEPGLLLEVHPIYCDDVRRTLFYKVRKANPALWAYAGEYVGRVAGKLWKEEYAALGDVVSFQIIVSLTHDSSSYHPFRKGSCHKSDTDAEGQVNSRFGF